jgi:hypothetical protein
MKKKYEKPWLVVDFKILCKGLDVDSKQLSLITFTLQKNRFFESFQGILDFSKLKSY